MRRIVLALLIFTVSASSLKIDVPQDPSVSDSAFMLGPKRHKPKLYRC